MVFPLPNICTNRGADPLICGPPRRPAGVCMMLISLFRLRDEGVPRGSGGPPSNLRPDPAVAKTMWHWAIVPAAAFQAALRAWCLQWWVWRCLLPSPLTGDFLTLPLASGCSVHQKHEGREIPLAPLVG